MTAVATGTRALRTVVCEELVRAVDEGLLERPEAVILTGSVARDEATIVAEGAGWRLLGDLDLFAVYNSNSACPDATVALTAESVVAERLKSRGVIAHLSIAIVDRCYLSGLQRHIATYELKNNGMVIWGDPSALDLVPSFTPSDIALEDAWRLLGNRIIEYLEASAQAPDGDLYCAVKLCLDTATSYLVFAGLYAPTYRARERALHEINATSCDAPFDILQFRNTVTACTHFKCENANVDLKVGQLHLQVLQFAHALWRWELQRLSGATTGPRTDFDLIAAWMHRQTVRAKVRGWMSVVRRSGWLRSSRSWYRWLRLGVTASPRYWTYAVAAEVVFVVGQGNARVSSDQVAALVALLPYSAAEDQKPTATTRDLIRLIAVNYHAFLEATTA